jgi:hypothetical protein
VRARAIFTPRTFFVEIRIERGVFEHQKCPMIRRLKIALKRNRIGSLDAPRCAGRAIQRVLGQRRALAVTASLNHQMAGQFSLTLRCDRPNITLGDDFEALVARQRFDRAVANPIFLDAAKHSAIHLSPSARL